MVGGGGAYVVDCVVRFHTVLVSLVYLSFQVKRGLRYHSARHWIIVISVIFYPYVSYVQVQWNETGMSYGRLMFKT